jgi:hypothetical protein
VAVEPGTVLCRDLDAGYTATYRGDAALADCVRDPRLQDEAHRREARLGAGAFDFGDGRRLELGARWTIRGAGVDATRVHASRATVDVFGDDIHSAFLVRGPGVTLAGFTFDGFCHVGPSPGPGCEPKHQNTLLAIVVACGFGAERPPDCDVDGLLVEDVRVVGAKTPFLATSTPPDPAKGTPGLFANFRDLHWTIRRFQVTGRDKSFRYARVFELGNAATAELSQGPGVGVEAPRRYVVDIEDSDVDTHVGRWSGELAGILTAAVNDDRVDLRVNLRRSRWRGVARLVGLANHAVPGDGADDGRLAFRCSDSELVADARDAAPHGGSPCPRSDAAIEANELSRAGGRHRIEVALERCAVRAEPAPATCPPSRAIDLGPPEQRAHVALERDAESAIDPPLD